jgi:glutathione S-transferase
MSIIYHITPAAAWQEAQAAGAYTADSLAAEGFIHLSTRAQVLWVAARFYRGQPGLLLLAVDEARLTAELRYEESEPGQRFPHLYGPLNLDAVVAAHPFPPEADGSFRLPDGA